MSEEIISKEKLEERYKKVIIRTEETINPFSGEKQKRTVVDLIHDGITYYVHIEFSPSGTTYSGDMGYFMFQPGYGIGTFKGETINPDYWGEKIKAAGQEYFIRDFEMQNVDRAYKEEILRHYEYEWEKEFFEEAKKAWEMSDDDFEKWYETWRERDDEEVGPDYAEEVKRVRDAGKPSDYADHDSEESAYDAVETASKESGLDWDFETIDDIASNGKGDCYRFLYACCVLQWVANKIVDKGRRQMSEKLPEYVFHQFDYLFDKMDGAHFGEAEIVGILHGAKLNGTYPGADYVYRYIQRLQSRLREEKERTLHNKFKRCLDKAELCRLEQERIELIECQDITDYDFDKLAKGFYKKWRQRWLELADKFKEAK